jgi:ABC-type transport system involved in multi-copper enzyme maturation permease subunit
MNNNLAYPLYILKIHRGLIIFAMILVAFFQFLIIWLMSTINYVPILEAILNQLPPQMKILFNQEFMNRLSINGAAAFGFNHPIVLTVLGIVAIILPTRHIAGEIETGTLELFLSYPVSRIKLIISLASSSAVILFAIVLTGWIGSFLSLIIFNHYSANIAGQLLKIGLNLWILLCLITSISLLISVYGREAGKTGLRSAGIVLIFYFLNFIASLWTALEFTLVINPFHYYQPQKLMFGEQSFLLNVGVLLISAVCFFLITLRHFAKRDIP